MRYYNIAYFKLSQGKIYKIRVAVNVLSSKVMLGIEIEEN